MGFRERMNKSKSTLKDRHNTPPKSSGAYPTIFNKSAIPEGVTFFKCKEGEHMVDILPWEVGSSMPVDETGENPITDKGDFDYILDVFVHQNVGSMNKPFVCPWENFRLPCPICEYIKANRLPKEEWSKVRAKRRSIYLIWDRSSSVEEKKGVQIFDVAHFFMEEKLEEIAKLPRGGGYITFSDPDEGKTVCWKRKGAGQENTSYIGHKFIDRESRIPDRILDQTFALDQVIDMHPAYEEIKESFYGKKDVDEDEKSTKENKKSTKEELKPKKKKKKSKDESSSKRAIPQEQDDDIPF